MAKIFDPDSWEDRAKRAEAGERIQREEYDRIWAVLVEVGKIVGFDIEEYEGDEFSSLLEAVRRYGESSN